MQKSELPQFDLFVQNCKKQDKKISPSIVALIIQENQRLSGVSLTTSFNYEAKKAERVKWKKLEETLSKLLQNEMLPNHRTAFEEMFDFAVYLGTDRTLEKNIEKVLEKLKAYDCKDSDFFNSSTLETFIEYLDAVLARRKIEVELRAYRNS